MRQLRVTFFGDSICVGQNVSLHRGWVPRIAATLGELAKKLDRDIIVANSSANGRTTREALLKMPYEIQSKAPDILIVQFGMNDCNGWESDRGIRRVSPRSFEANLHEIIDRARRFGCAKIVLNTNHPTPRQQEVSEGSDTTYEESNQQYNAIVRTVATARKSDVELNEIDEAFFRHADGDPRRLADLVLPPPDSLHPSELGHEIYFQTVCPGLVAAIEEIARAE